MAIPTVLPADELTGKLREWIETLAVRSLHDMSRYVRASGLSMPQFGVLMRLYHHGPCGVSEIGDHMDITSPAASQLVDKLVQHGLVERKEDPRDRRARTLTLTDRGRALVDTGAAERHRWLEETLAGLGQVEREIVTSAFRILSKAMREQEILAGNAPRPEERKE
jgi:DNA-binding MarR family transcriptional regulator